MDILLWGDRSVTLEKNSDFFINMLTGANIGLIFTFIFRYYIFHYIFYHTTYSNTNHLISLSKGWNDKLL